jgi:hypothetical protein
MWPNMWPSVPGTDFNQGVRNSANVDWGAAAQQWLKSREYYEQWQQQQWQMMAATMAAAAAAPPEKPPVEDSGPGQNSDIAEKSKSLRQRPRPAVNTTRYLPANCFQASTVTANYDAWNSWPSWSQQATNQTVANDGSTRIPPLMDQKIPFYSANPLAASASPIPPNDDPKARDSWQASKQQQQHTASPTGLGLTFGFVLICLACLNLSCLLKIPNRTRSCLCGSVTASLTSKRKKLSKRKRQTTAAARRAS